MSSKYREQPNLHLPPKANTSVGAAFNSSLAGFLSIVHAGSGTGTLTVSGYSIINTGNAATPVSVALVDSSGATSNSVTLIPSLPAGGAQ